MGKKEEMEGGGMESAKEGWRNEGRKKGGKERRVGGREGIKVELNLKNINCICLELMLGG